MNSPLRRAIVICALGYFIDVFDIQLFAVLRIPSLTALGVAADRMAAVGGNILNAQMLGMILGAIVWGYLGDRHGRIKALYGSILIYSLGTLACSVVQDPLSYGALRFVTGFGLAGETGAATTLICELMERKSRGWGMTIIAGFGAFGPAFAVLVSWLVPWRETYVVAGVLGLILLVLRMKLVEPSLFQKISAADNDRGSWRLIFQRRQFSRFSCCFAIGLPLIYAFSLLGFFSLELGTAVLKAGEVFSQKIALLMFFIGFGLGDIASGAISQLCQSRIKSMRGFLALGAITVAVYFLAGPQAGFSALEIYGLYLSIGVAAGCWVLFTTIATESFGTNIRATVAITATNFIRGFTIPMVFVFQALRSVMSITDSAALIGGVLYLLAFFALSKLKETYDTDLDYVEKITSLPRTGGI